MKSFYLYNGDLTTDAPRISAKNSGFLLGESVFTSFSLFQGKALCVNEHKKRLNTGCLKLFGFQNPFWAQFSEIFPEALRADHNKAFTKNSYRVRLSVFLEDGEPAYLASLLPFNESMFERGMPMELRVSPLLFEKRVTLLDFSTFKYGSYADRLFLKKKVIQEGFDDVLFIGQSGQVFELSTSNIVSFRRGRFESPGSGPNVLQGIQLRHFEKFLNSQGERLYYQSLKLDDLKDSSFAFSFNCVTGVKVISYCGERKIDYAKSDAVDVWKKYQKYCRNNLESFL